MKKCNVCGLSVEEGAIFVRNKKAKGGLSYRCKECNRKRRKKYYYSEKGTADRKLYGQSEKCKEAQKQYSQSEECKEVVKRYRQSKKGKETQKKYKQSEKGKKKEMRYRQSEKYKETRKKYLQSERHKEVVREYIQSGRRTEALKKYRQNVKHRISNCLSSAIRSSLKGNKNGRQWESIAGWTLQQFKNRFNQLFKPGMTWENHGEVWEIDHIIPLNAHNITSSECTDFKRAWALSNLQPLLKEENNFKRDKIEKPFQPTMF